MSSWLKILVVACAFVSIAAPANAQEAKKPPTPVEVKSFRELAKAKKGSVLLLNVAPSGVVTSPGLIYAEPCDPKDPAIQKRTGLAGTVEVEDVPQPVAEQMNAKNNAEFEKKSAITCYRVTAKLKSSKGGWTKLAFVSAEPSGSRPYDEKLNPSRGD